MSVYDTLVSMPQEHRRIKGHGYIDLMTFDFTTHSIRNGSYYFMKNGQLCVDVISLRNGSIITINSPFFTEEEANDPWKKVEELYYQYLISRPTEVANYLHPNFRAKSADELSFDELVTGIPRQQALYAFEGYLMLGIVSGVLKWPEDKHWYWKSETYPGLILYKSWF